MNMSHKRQHGDSPDLGEVLAEYRVSRVVVGASWLLTILSVGLCLVVITEAAAEISSGDRESAWQAFVVLIILAIAFAAAIVLTLASSRTRFTVFERGLLRQTAFKTQTFDFPEIVDMQIGRHPIFLLKPHLVITIGNPDAKPCYICPFLISDFKIFEVVRSTWKDAV